MTTRSAGVGTLHRCGQRHVPLTPVALLLLGTCNVPDVAEAVRLELTPPHAIIAAGGTVGLTVKVVPGDDTQPPTTVAWSSSDPTVVEVDASGTVRARAPGFAFVRAEALGATADAGIGVDVEILVGAGDIGDCARPNDEATAALLDRIPGTVFTAGDNAYPAGTTDDYARCYHPNWGRHRTRTRPAPGNHEYLTPAAAGYFGYFGPSAGDPAEGYYSYDLSAWHVVVLNSNIPVDPGSPQESWLRADLAANSSLCTLLYWHHPRFSSGTVASSTRLQPVWQVLSEAEADVAVTAHSHTYERFAPLADDGALDPLGGTRQFVVGTGGGQLLDLFDIIEAHSEARNNDTWGVLVLILHPTRYEWRFLPVDGTFTDSGSTDCH